MIFRITSLLSLSLTLALAIITGTPAQAEIAVRDESTSEGEFRAQALAVGHTPMSEWLTSESLRRIAPELTEMFRLRLIDAQTEWLNRSANTTGHVSGHVSGPISGTVTPMIDRFLELATAADWTAADRKAFSTFFIRKFEMMNGEESVRTDLRSFLIDNSIDESLMTPAFKIGWKEKDKSDRADWVSASHLASALPPDIVIVMINGRIFERESLLSLQLPRKEFRLTLISNLYQPATVLVSNAQLGTAIPIRTPWIGDDCRTRVNLAILGDEAHVAAISTRTCAQANEKAKLKLDENVLAKFGVQSPEPTLPNPPAQTTKSILKKPWFWGAVGVVVVGAVIAIERNQNQANIRPVSRDGW